MIKKRNKDYGEKIAHKDQLFCNNWNDDENIKNNYLAPRYFSVRDQEGPATYFHKNSSFTSYIINDINNNSNVEGLQLKPTEEYHFLI